MKNPGEKKRKKEHTLNLNMMILNLSLFQGYSQCVIICELCSILAGFEPEYSWLISIPVYHTAINALVDSSGENAI